MNQVKPISCPVILLVDDDEDILNTLKGNLELDGYEVITARDGVSGMNEAKNRKPDLMILDLNLPDIDGIKACQILRRQFDFPIIMLTARDSVSDKVLGLECGADDYVVKPFNFLELSARIRVVFKRLGNNIIDEIHENKDLWIDFKARKIKIRNEEVPLTRKEYEILELFTLHPDEVLSRDYIRSCVWRESDLYQHSRTVDVHVQRLRKKIESDPNHPIMIVTVSGMGYKYSTR